MRRGLHLGGQPGAPLAQQYSRREPVGRCGRREGDDETEFRAAASNDDAA